MQLLDVLKKKFPDSSHRTLKLWLKQKRIAYQGEVVDQPFLQVSDIKKVELLPPPKKSVGKIKIVFEDRDLIVIEKPKGLLSVNTPMDPSLSAHKILRQSLHKKNLHIVHRLDRDTQGLLVFAYTKSAYENLKEQFQKKSAGREYLAILDGTLKNKKGMWKHHLFEDKNCRMHVSEKNANTKQATTLFQVLHEKDKQTLVHFRLRSGKKHQLRVQSKYMGAPIIGDQKYHPNPSKYGLALHAFSLVLTHPRSGKKMFFYSQPTKAFFYFYPELKKFLAPYTTKQKV